MGERLYRAAEDLPGYHNVNSHFLLFYLGIAGSDAIFFMDWTHISLVNDNIIMSNWPPVPDLPF